MNSSFRSGSGPKSTQLLRDLCLSPGALWIQRKLQLNPLLSPFCRILRRNNWDL